jgi:hypothetical protein
MRSRCPLLLSAFLVAGCASAWPTSMFYLKHDPAEVATGEFAPPFALADARGGTVSLGALLEGGSAVLVFYRGAW